MKLRGLLGFAAADKNLITVIIFMQLLLKGKKTNPNKQKNPNMLWATDKIGTGLIQKKDRHKIQKLQKGQRSKGVIIPIPLAKDRRKHTSPKYEWDNN